MRRDDFAQALRSVLLGHLDDKLGVETEVAPEFGDMAEVVRQQIIVGLSFIALANSSAFSMAAGS